MTTQVVAAADNTRKPTGAECNIPCARGVFSGEPPCGSRSIHAYGWECTREADHRGIHAAHTRQDKGPVRVWEDGQ